MQIKSFKLFPVTILIVIILSLVVGCGKQGTRFKNLPPSIEITSYEGYDPQNPYTDSTIVTLFQQKIFWNASDPDGTITGYAYRVLNDEGIPISTAGNKYIDSLGVVTPQNVLDRFPGTGWVLHYKQGADQLYPLNDSRAKRTIWTTNKYALINFLASTATGLPDTTLSRFEVICVDNRGEICEKAAFRRFKSYSGRPTCFLSTTKGDPAGDEVGTGIRLRFTIDDTDPFIQPTAWYYKFRIQKLNATTNSIISDSPDWFTTVNQPKIDEYLLTKYTIPPISSDFDSLGVKRTITRVIARVVDLAGIESVSDTITFAVKEGFHPNTLMHFKRIYALGNHHFVDYMVTDPPEIWPYTIVNNKQIFATPLFIDKEGYYTAVNSPNLKVWLRWGWHGEYGVPTANGTTITDDPFDKKVDILLHDNTLKNYYSEITHFDIRFNGKPYDYPPLANSIQVDSGTGKRWLRVPINSSLGQTIVLTNLPANTPDNPYHFFEVRAVDLQNEYDPTPAEFKLKIVEPINKEDKNGILVIDDDIHNANYAPEDSIDARYNNMLSTYTGEKVVIKRASLLYTDIALRKIALSDIQRFKFIVYHNDFPTQTSNFTYDQDAYSLYLNQGGNMLISAGGKLSSDVQALQLTSKRIFNNYFGVLFTTDASSSVTNDFLAKSWFVKAISMISAEYNDISLAFDLNVNNPLPVDFYHEGQLIVADPNERSVNVVMNTRKGLGPVTIFNSYDDSYNSGVTPIFKYGSKPVFVQPFPTPNYYCPQTQADYNSVTGANQYVGLRKYSKKNNVITNRCYILGFPLSYMKKADSQLFMSKIITEVMAN